MDIHISVITKSEQFREACVRFSSIHSLQRCCSDIATESETFDALLVAFEQRPEDFLEADGVHERMYKVVVGMGVSRTFRPEDDHAFLCLVAEQVSRALGQSPLSAGVRDDVIARIHRWTGSLAK